MTVVNTVVLLAVPSASSLADDRLIKDVYKRQVVACQVKMLLLYGSGGSGAISPKFVKMDFHAFFHAFILITDEEVQIVF